MREPVDHILRPTLPWRVTSAMTECGLNAESVKTLSRDQYSERRKDMGQQRAALMTCMTCSNTAVRWGTWSEDPRRAIEREVQWETAWRRSDHGDLLRDELTVIAELIETHRDDFDSRLSLLSQRRAWLVQKAARGTRA